MRATITTYDVRVCSDTSTQIIWMGVAIDRNLGHAYHRHKDHASESSEYVDKSSFCPPPPLKRLRNQLREYTASWQQHEDPEKEDDLIEILRGRRSNGAVNIENTQVQDEHRHSLEDMPILRRPIERNFVKHADHLDGIDGHAKSACCGQE